MNKQHSTARMAMVCLLLGVSILPLVSTQAGGFKDLFKSKAKELLDKGKEIAIKKASKLVFPMEADSASARPSEPLLDQFDPAFEPMDSLDRTSDGGFKLEAGAFEFEAQSYCLKPGTYQRPGGNGYMSGPLKGKLAPYLTEILHQAWKHKEISQQDIQYLLWGIIAGARPKDMNPHIYQIAKLLLSRKMVKQLNGGVEGQIPDQLTDEALAALPESARKLYDTLSEMKRLAAEPDTSYEDLEQIAVLPGEPPQIDDSDAVPEGRWTYHPDGYFIRYFSNEYFKTKVQIVVPEKFKLIRDKFNRITNIIFDDGSGIETEYDDSVRPQTLAEFRDHAIYKLKKVTYRAFDKKLGKLRQLIRKNLGWIIGPVQEEQLNMEYQETVASYIDSFSDYRSVAYHPTTMLSHNQLSGFGVINLAAFVNQQSPKFVKVQSNALGRIYNLSQMVNDWNSDMEFYRDRARAQTRPLSDQDLYNIVDLDHYQSGARSALGETGDRLGWLIEHFEREQRAIARATQMINDLDKDPSETGLSYLPWLESGLPGSHSYSQRRGLSGRSY